MYNIKKVLVTTDFSDYSSEALDYAISIADVHGAELHLLHVLEPKQTRADATETSCRKQMKQFVYDKIDELIWLKQAVRSGRAHEEIIRYAKENGIDLIVMATHGRTGLSHIIMGSVAEKVCRFSPVPVLTVKPAAILERLVTEEDVVHDLHISGE